MSIITDVRSSRRLARYKVLFRASAMSFGAAALATGLGILALVFGSGGELLLAGLLFAVLACLNGYKIALSTMTIIDREGEQTWRNLEA